jgi:[protein-PII] uridylyltransferase
VQESAPDVGVMTTLLEARCISGDPQLFEAMRAALAPERVWPVREFFEAKLAEQAERHLKANDTAYNLEPNVKTGPGRPARHPDDRLGREAPFRRQHAR